MCDIPNVAGLKRLDEIPDVFGIVATVGVRVQVGIPQVKRPLQLYENRQEGLASIEVVAMFVALIPIVLVGTKHVGNDIGALIVFCQDCPTVHDVEVVVGMLVVDPSYDFILEIK